ncbi:MAG: GNAT family N-acetyltransferase [Rhodospirillaceae bacterium]|nr:GNAT family N-acetyltransferase [Rhodospirillaceae bacterium]
MNFLAPRDLLVTVTTESCPLWGELEARWRDLENRADGSFFTSWTWIGAWLATFGGSGQAPRAHLLIARAGDAIVGLAVVGERRAGGFLRSGVAAALNQSGEPEDDALFIEYNDFLLDRRFAPQTRAAMLRFIADTGASRREFRLSGATPALHRAVTESGLSHWVVRDRVCPWIDLTKVPPGLSGYLAVLSRNTRRQIQQSLRLYEAEGKVQLTPARTAADAEIMLDEMHTLHRKSWRDRRGHEGAFGSSRFMRFARHLAAKGTAHGSVQLMRVSSGPNSIGYLLNFVHRGQIYAYQSGFSYRDDNRFRPGLVTHALAVVQAREQGCLGYHFMAGEGRYKASLANTDEHLFWMTLRQGDFIARAEDSVHALKDRLRALLRR